MELTLENIEWVHSSNFTVRETEAKEQKWLAQGHIVSYS